ncbi:hypothetical protein RJ640_005852 [Escallonia rubra]|uniref:Uncharacterized protein n=1 Tax=Escallonia rubra TaxID=112253 RepID=A0AA88RBR2_9ASTE|nr:hypothetical protein RJ640_005852 [Escallonia rubra]
MENSLVKSRAKDLIMKEGSATTKPPLLKSKNNSYWKNRMRNFLRQDTHDGTNGTKVPKGILKMDAHEAQIFSTDKKAKNIISCGLDMNKYNRVSACETTKEIWRLLEVTHEELDTAHGSRISQQAAAVEISKKKKFKPRKALLAWDDSNESDKQTSEDDDVAQLCFMAKNDRSDEVITAENFDYNKLE